MYTIPAQVSDTEYSLFVILEDENLERIRSYDPAEVTIGKLQGPWTQLKLKDVVLMYATPVESKALLEAAQGHQDIKPLLRDLSRGWQFRPERGDNDGPYMSLRKKAN